MRHRKKGRQLSRTRSHRRATLRNLATSLFMHGRIETTTAKAKELRPYAERLITLARRGDVHARRLAATKIQDRHVLGKLFDEIAPQYAERPGGYTRVLKLGNRRVMRQRCRSSSWSVSLLAANPKKLPVHRTIDMPQNASRRGAADMGMILMVAAFAIIGGFMFWLNGQATAERAAREVVEEVPDETPVDTGAPGIPLGDVAGGFGCRPRS